MESAPLTMQTLMAAIADVENATPRPPCGSRERPHVMAPNCLDICTECGWVKP